MFKVIDAKKLESDDIVRMAYIDATEKYMIDVYKDDKIFFRDYDSCKETFDKIVDQDSLHEIMGWS
jgi:hypothetical protein